MKTSRLVLACVAMLVAGAGARLVAEESRVIPDLHLRLVWIKPGEFDLGTKESGNLDTQPITHVVLTRGFWLGITEVTQVQWTAIMGKNPSSFKGDTLPVDSVTWDAAMQFCEKLTQRERAAGRLSADLAYTLPTEAQWEYACRAGRTGYDVGMINQIYNDFTQINAMSWNSANSTGTTHSVGHKKPNAWGLYDMQGNVVEWCRSSFMSAEQGYPGGTITDPNHTPTADREELRLFRGGSYGAPPYSCTSTNRWWQFRDWQSPSTGLRLALCPVK